MIGYIRPPSTFMRRPRTHSCWRPTYYLLILFRSSMSCARSIRGRAAHDRDRLRLHLGKMPEGFRHLLGRILVVLELPGQIRLVGREVEEPVTAEVEDDRLLLAFLLALERFVD